MSREFNRYIELQFAIHMKRLGFEPSKPSGPIAWPGERCFHVAGDETACWICIFPNHKGYNEFNVELAWSHLGSYPASCTVRPTPRAQAPDCFTTFAQGFIRLGDLASPPRVAWGPETVSDQLAKLERTAVPALADPLIGDALRTIENVGLPLAAAAVASRPTYLRSAA